MTIVQNSILAGVLLRLWSVLSTAWNNCFLMRFCRSAAKWWSGWWNGSALVGFCMREGALNRAWAKSIFCRLLSALFDLPAAILHRLYAKFRSAFDHSLCATLVFSAGDHVPVALGWMMLLIMIIPYGRWNNAYSFAGCVLLLMLTVVGGMRRRTLRLSAVSLGPYAIGFFLAAAAAFILSPYPDLSRSFVIYYFTCAMGLLLVVCTVERPQQLERLAAFLCLGMLGAAAYGIFQGIVGVENAASWVDSSVNEGMPGRVYSFYDNANSFAQMLVLFIPIAVGLFLGGKKKLWRAVGLVSALAGIVSLLLTYSRACWLGFAFAAILFVFLWRRSLLPLLFLAALACIPLLPDSIINRFLTIFNMNDSSTSSRFPLYQAALELIKVRPITGGGLGYHAVKQSIMNNGYRGSYVAFAHVHNFFLQVWLETGLLGILSFFGVLLGPMKMGGKAVRARQGDPSARMVVLGTLCGLAGVLVCGLADYPWTYPRVMFLFWFAAGLLLAGVKLLRSAEANN